MAVVRPSKPASVSDFSGTRSISDRVEAGLSGGQRQQAAVQAGAHDGEIEPIAVAWPIDGSRPGWRQAAGAVRAIRQTADQTTVNVHFAVDWHVTLQPPVRNLGGASARWRTAAMKMVMAIIKPFKLDEVRDALTRSASRA